MGGCYELKNLTCTIDRAAVFKAVQCSKDSPVYGEILQEYENIFPKVSAMLKPVGAVGLSTLPASAETGTCKAGTPVLYMCTSIGSAVSEESRRAFQTGDYTGGLLCDAIADCALFSLEKAAVEQVQKICSRHHVGIKARLSAPEDLPMSIQGEIWETLSLEKRFGIRISDGSMLDPVKTVCTVFVLTEDAEVFQAAHDCRKCKNTGCLFRNVPDMQVIVRQASRTEKIFVREQESLMDALIRQDYAVHAACGGKGRCGKCGVQILRGDVPASEADRQVLSQEELQTGWRLSCAVYPQEELEIALQEENRTGFDILTEHGARYTAAAVGDGAYTIAVDIGTTTLAMELLCGGRVMQTASMVNSQRIYGADVISRIEASTSGKKRQLQDCIRKDLKEGISELLAKGGIGPEQLQRIAVSGNTTMVHLLMGYDCDTLGVFPFQPVTLDFICGSGRDILGFDAAQATVLPSISTFVGGDIVAGLYSCGFHASEKICLLIDLGTNGEMALGNRERILVTSTAAGPAFEGGNITWGMGSVNGAICSADYHGDELCLGTIGGGPPAGICGTGVVELAASLADKGIIAETGTLCDEFFSSGVPLADTSDDRTIVFVQKDIRELQLAKAAIRGGLETLLLKYGVKKEDVDTVYLAGGFGYRLDTAKAIRIGMLPIEFAGRIQAVGNSSLAGVEQYLLTEGAEEDLRRIVRLSEEINLGAEKMFNDFYTDAMFFEESFPSVD